MDIVDRLSLKLSSVIDGSQSDGNLSRRKFMGKSAAVIAGIASAVGVTKLAGAEEASAVPEGLTPLSRTYSTYVVSDGANSRGAASTSSAVVRTYACGTRLTGFEVVGDFASSCNEFNNNVWFYVPAQPGFVHRGNLDPSSSACQCY